MSVPRHPVGYDVTNDVSIGRSDCHITVGFDQQGNQIPRFLVRLHHATSFYPLEWAAIARFDHNESDSGGHDIYKEGIHIDVTKCSGGEVKLRLSHTHPPQNTGKVIRWCVEYFDQEADYFVDVYEETITPANPPSWPDGGQPSRTLISEESVPVDMALEPRGEETVSKEELSTILADATDTTAEDIEEGAADFEIGPPEDAEVVETDE